MVHQTTSLSQERERERELASQGYMVLLSRIIHARLFYIITIRPQWGLQRTSFAPLGERLAKPFNIFFASPIPFLSWSFCGRPCI